MLNVNADFATYVRFIVQDETTYNSPAMGRDKERRELGKIIRELRKARGFTQEKLGEKADLSYKFIGELERGRVNVSLDSLAKLAQALGVQTGDLFRKGKGSLKVVVKEKSPFSKLSSQEVQTIKKALSLLNRVFSKL